MIGALTITACGSGDTVVDKPRAKACSDSPQNGAQVADEQGKRFQSTFADVTAGPSMSSDVSLKPGAKALGWVVFEVPKASKRATVQFAMDSGFAEETGEWKLT